METKEIMKMVLSPKIWLLIVLVLHTAVGVIAQTDFSVDAEAERAGAVSYTHLTLPTIYSV